ncbi:DUF1934 domain-containing protein [uncultured Limosilactobacillus sp.]|uniref:DUF1934 domain-containing protein n=1 Tax=uncultured Limosilactobacillus sp. TaxID=2837629 RepID=UPI0025E381AB|nr:DUF1934 domain-containing protein [uncultured Limosilactobacillus sp.]
MKEVIPVKVKMTSQINQDGQTERFSFEEDGQLATVGGKHYLRYTEHQQGVATPVQFRFDDDRVHLRRAGDRQTHLVFDRKNATSSQYQTAYGPIELRVHTTQLIVAFDWDQSQGQLELKYELRSAGTLVGSYHVSLQFHR